MKLGQNDMFCLINIWLTQKHTGLKRLDQASLRFVVIYTRMVWSQTSARISSLLPAPETKSDRSEFIASPASCKYIGRTVRRTIHTHASLSSSWSHVNTPFGLKCETRMADRSSSPVKFSWSCMTYMKLPVMVIKTFYQYHLVCVCVNIIMFDPTPSNKQINKSLKVS